MILTEEKLFRPEKKAKRNSTEKKQSVECSYKTTWSTVWVTACSTSMKWKGKLGA